MIMARCSWKTCWNRALLLEFEFPSSSWSICHFQSRLINLPSIFASCSKLKDQCLFFQISFPPIKLLLWLPDGALKPGLGEAESYCRELHHMFTVTLLYTEWTLSVTRTCFDVVVVERAVRALTQCLPEWGGTPQRVCKRSQGSLRRNITLFIYIFTWKYIIIWKLDFLIRKDTCFPLLNVSGGLKSTERRKCVHMWKLLPQLVHIGVLW